MAQAEPPAIYDAVSAFFVKRDYPIRVALERTDELEASLVKVMKSTLLPSVLLISSASGTTNLFFFYALEQRVSPKGTMLLRVLILASRICPLFLASNYRSFTSLGLGVIITGIVASEWTCRASTSRFFGTF